MPADLTILAEDEELLAVDKPSGLAVHRGWAPEEDVLVARLRQRLGGPAYLLHRLDRGTSGVVLVARTPAAARRYGPFFQDRELAQELGSVDKRYLALVRGLAPEALHVDHPVPRADGARVPARTDVRRLAMVLVASSPHRERRYSLVEARPLSGRLHQVRRHLKHLGNPVIGDSTHGRLEHNRWLAAEVGLRRLALHAAELVVRDALGAVRFQVSSPLPEDLGGPLARMGFELDRLGAVSPSSSS